MFQVGEYIACEKPSLVKPHGFVDNLFQFFLTGLFGAFDANFGVNLFKIINIYAMIQLLAFSSWVIVVGVQLKEVGV